MSLSENYHKVALGVAGFAVVAAGAMIFLGSGKVDEDFAPMSRGTGNAAGAPSHSRLKTAIESMQTSKELPSTMQGSRRIDTFAGLPIFVRKGQEDQAIDLLSPSSAPVHDPIPNTWWDEHGIDLGYENSPQLDADGDGFTNLEEFEANTNPAKASDYPALINKLNLVSVDKEQFLVEFTRFGDTEARFRLTAIVDGKQERLNTATLQPGSLFPAEGPYANAFLYQGREQRQYPNPRNGQQVDIEVAIVIDQRENLKGRELIVPGRRLPGVRNNGLIAVDRFAILTLEAIGEQGKQQRIAEGEAFSLPFGGEEKTYKIVSIDENDVVNIAEPATDRAIQLQP